MNFNVHKAQAKFLTSKAKEVFYISGVGSGKSMSLALKAYEKLSIKGSVGLICAPTTKTLKNSTLKQFQNAWNLIGFKPKDHYVINKKPPEFWNVQPFSELNNNSILTTNWGSYAILDGLDNFDSHRGIEVDYILVDEYRDVKEGAREVLVSRLRGKTFKNLGLQQTIHYATTPPKNPNYIRKIVSNESQNIEFIFGNSYDNIKNLPAGYIEALKEQYDEITFRREVMGELISLNNKLFAYAFEFDKHCEWLIANYNMPIYLSFDFNVNPMTCIATQRTPNQIHVLKEWRLPNSNIYDMLNQVNKYSNKFANVFVTGDASGNNKNAMVRDNYTYYKIIAKELELGSDNINVPTSNPKHENSFQLTNSLLLKHGNLKIDKSCVWLIEDLEMVGIKDDGTIDKEDAARGHLLDCFRYQLYTYDRNFKM
jgi:phage terminase large subunit